MPLILSSLARIDVISNAMELRGFGKDKKKRTWYMGRPLKRNDWLTIGLGIVLLVLSAVITFWDGDRFFNPFV
ncbi:MAG: energy-coupling factor transporter transmembrane protein EcfT [Lachnospiraceae bacterium]|nr:energy-coupling factor transporter transmembrane protein EcfT [Lachnospiraceae bacterium]